MSDHMESPTDPTRTRCGRDVNHVPDFVFYYGDDAATCKTCRRLYAKDVAKIDQEPRRKFKCIRTDCGRSGCESSVPYSHPDPEFCIYDCDEAYWTEIKGGDDS